MNSPRISADLFPNFRLCILLLICLSSPLNAALQLAHTGIDTNGSGGIRLTGSAGLGFAIEASANLMNWFVLKAGRLTNGIEEIKQADVRDLTQLFYRARTSADSEIPNPLSVTVALNTNRTVSAEITGSGGVLSLTNNGGTIYRLSIPTNALISEEQIAMTLVDRIDGLPLTGGLLGAAQFSPDGLRLLEPATLTIQFASAPPTNQTLGFSYHGGGQEFHLFPKTVSGNTVTFLISHFSGNGAGTGTGSDRDAQKKRSPTRSEDRANQDLEIELAPLVPPDDPELVPLVKAEQILESQFSKIVRPKLIAAEANEPLVDEALSAFLGWAAQASKYTSPALATMPVRNSCGNW